MEEGNHQVDGGHDAMERLLRGKVRPTAVLASNDMTAIGALGAIHESGLRVPGDISIVGFDDIQISAFTMPALTTVRLSRDEIARVAFRALYSIRQDGGKGAEYSVRPSLVVRQSTGRALAQPAKRARPSAPHPDEDLLNLAGRPQTLQLQRARQRVQRREAKIIQPRPQPEPRRFRIRGVVGTHPHQNIRLPRHAEVGRWLRIRRDHLDVLPG